MAYTKFRQFFSIDDPLELEPCVNAWIMAASVATPPLDIAVTNIETVRGRNGEYILNVCYIEMTRYAMTEKP